MPQSLIFASVRNCAEADVSRNVDICRDLTTEAAANGARLVCLPEYFSGVILEGGRFHPIAFPEGRRPDLQAFTDLARDKRLWLLLGFLGVIAQDGRKFNRAYVFSPDGAIAARYDKLHLFDVDLDSVTSVRESATIAPGKSAVVARTLLISIGLSICYDPRFAGLYRAPAQGWAELLAVPCAFTRPTGVAHWHVLNRASANFRIGLIHEALRCFHESRAACY